MDKNQCRRSSEYYASSIYEDDILSRFGGAAWGAASWQGGEWRAGKGREGKKKSEWRAGQGSGRAPETAYSR